MQEQVINPKVKYTNEKPGNIPGFLLLNMKKEIKKQYGFTLIEMMVGVALIGILASVSLANFKHYQSKSKSVEAKVQLSSVFIAMQSFYNTYDIYMTCLNYMGYIPSENQKMSYAIGFPSITTNVNADVYASSVNSSLSIAECPNNSAPVQDETFFLARTGEAGVRMDSLSLFQASIINSSNALNKQFAPSVNDVEEGIGTSSSFDEILFVAAAAGYISVDRITPTTSSLWTINSNKILRNVREGY
jgi:type IV pilus assembly protein PilA